MNAYYLNTLIRLSCVFTATSNGAAADPTSVTATATDTNGLVQTLTVVHDSTGHYHADLTPTVWGDWSYTFTGAGAVVASAQGQLFIEPGV